MVFALQRLAREIFNSREKITEAGLLLLGLGAVLWYLTINLGPGGDVAQ